MSDAPGPFRDLQEYLAHLDAIGRLRRVHTPVDRFSEVPCIARLALECTPARDAYGILFERVRNHTVPIAVNLFYPHALYAGALRSTESDMLNVWGRAMRNPIDPVAVPGGPVHDVIETDNHSLDAVPAPIWTPGRDGGPYLSAAAVITRDPETGIQNLGTYRIQVHGSRRAGLFFGSARQHGAIHHRKYADRGEPMPVAVVVGAPPVVTFAAAAKTSYGIDEMTLAGGLAGEPIPVVDGVTVPLRVPARAEFVIEGFVPPRTTHAEGPFGEALGYMEAGGPAPMIETTAVSHRERPVHHGFVQQLPPTDGHAVMEMSLLGPLWHYATAKLGLTDLVDLAIVPGSAGVTALAVRVRRNRRLPARQIGRLLARIGFGQKWIYVVDEDIELRDLETLQWALSSRVDPARDIDIIDATETFQIDPSILARSGSAGDGPPYTSSLAVIDATIKAPSPAVCLPPADLLASVRDRWAQFGLPPIAGRGRLSRLAGDRDF